MAETNMEGQARTTADQWRERIADQGQSGLSVKQFCKDRGVTQWSFYRWRNRLRETGPIRFALVNHRTARSESAVNADLEVVFANGEQLRVRCAVDPATLRTVIEALRG